MQQSTIPFIVIFFSVFFIFVAAVLGLSVLLLLSGVRGHTFARSVLEGNRPRPAPPILYY